MELHQDNKKETLIIEKDPLFVPIESWKENNTQAKNYINKKIHSEVGKEAPHVIVPVAAVTSARAPPSVPPRNGSTVTYNSDPTQVPRSVHSYSTEVPRSTSSDDPTEVL